MKIAGYDPQRSTAQGEIFLVTEPPMTPEMLSRFEGHAGRKDLPVQFYEKDGFLVLKNPDALTSEAKKRIEKMLTDIEKRLEKESHAAAKAQKEWFQNFEENADLRPVLGTTFET